ncbi:MAG: DUF1893 domain-containing protein [Eubacteriales bacterium]
MDYQKEAIRIRQEQNATCVALSATRTYESTLKGVAPILIPLEEDNEFFKGCSVSDRVIGKAAALLFIKAQIKELHAELISDHAVALLESYEIPYSYDKKVPYIINRDGTGMCPMEECVLELNDLEEGYVAVTQRIKELRK